MLIKVIKAYNKAIFDIDRVEALKVIHNAVVEGVSPEDVTFKMQQMENVK
jgi:hypothetical protein